MTTSAAASASPDAEFWRGRRVLVTGHTGFKGAWVALWLRRLGAEVTGLALPPATEPSLFALAGLEGDVATRYVDIRDADAVAAAVRAGRPEVVLHLAAQALVHSGYRAPLDTFAINVQGTANVLEALRKVDTVRSVVAVTTDKVYRNLEHPYPYRESDALGGHDPYSASKAAAELVVACYRDAFLGPCGVAIASARAGNVIGGGDWAEDRLVPDAVRAWSAGETLQVRRPSAIRPWQHVLEPAAAYLRLAERLWHTPELADAYNFGPDTSDAATVRTVIGLAREAFGVGDVAWGDGRQGPHEAAWLTLEIAKARAALGVAPRWPLATAVRRTLDWYRALRAGANARVLCEADLDAFEAAPAAAQ